MRTILLLILSMCFCGILKLNAQFNTGRYFAGGNFSAYSAKNSNPVRDTKTKSLNANIQFGKIVKPNTIEGVILSYGSYKSTDPNSFADTNKTHSIGVGIFYRKYKKLTKNLTFFGEVNIEYTHAENAYNYSGQGSNAISDGGTVSFVPGISYTLCKAMQVELLMPDMLALSYAHQKTDYYNATPPALPNQEGNIFSASANLNSNLLSSFAIGFKFLLGKAGGSGAY